MKYCDFIVFTTAAIHIESVLFDPDFFSETERKLTKFFKLYIMPEILTKTLQTEASKAKKGDAHITCVCGRDNTYGAMRV